LSRVPHNDNILLYRPRNFKKLSLRTSLNKTKDLTVPNKYRVARTDYRIRSIPSRCATNLQTNTGALSSHVTLVTYINDVKHMLFAMITIRTEAYALFNRLGDKI